MLRPASEHDRDALVALQAGVHAGPDGAPNAAVGAWTRDLFERGHPTLGLEDVTVIEDRRNGALASSLGLVPQRWSYAGVPIGVGRLELVATHPDYRRRGLIRRQMEALHERSAARGDLLQVITDLLFFHSESGYHAALTQRAGRGGHARELPPAADEPVGLRAATDDDVRTLMEIDRDARARALVSCERDAAQWRHELSGRSADSMVRDEILLIESCARPVGYAVLGYGGIPSFPIPDWLPGLPCPERAVSIAALEVLPGIAWRAAATSVLRQLTAQRAADRYMLWLGVAHPAYEALADLLVRRPPSIAWFVRVPDLPRLIERLAPVLERRLIDSPGRDFSGTLRLHLYTHGVTLRFAEGRLVGADPWGEHSRRASDVSLPEAMLLQLLLGHARIDALEPAYPDFRMQTPIGRLLLGVLFPEQPSSIWPLI